MDCITFKDLGNQGRLGNQLFQIATTVACAIRRNLPVIFPVWGYNQYLQVPLPSLTNEIHPTHIYYEPTFEYYPILLDNSIALKSDADQGKKIYNLSGYFQSEKYFKEYADVIRGLFIPNAIVLKYLNEKYGNLLRNNFTCSVHVRRGDYVNNKFYHQLDLGWYTACFENVKSDASNVIFVVFSDDIQWCKENFSNLNCRFVFVENEIDFYDLILMAWCNCHIIANSSFSWWGAWLDIKKEKNIIFPAEWFGPASNHSHKDLYFM